MPYLLTDFNGVPLPRAMPRDDLGTGRVDSSLDNSIGGVYDTAGSRRRWPGRNEFGHRGIYEVQQSGIVERVTPDGDTRVTPTGDTRVVNINPFADLQYQTDTLKAQIGVRGPLWRERIYDHARQWKTCRLLQVKHVEEVKQAGAISEVDSLYDTAMNGWLDANPTVVNGAGITGVPANLFIENLGLLPVYDGVLSIARSSGTITQVIISGPGVDITWTGSLGASQTLVIDPGPQTVTIGGVDAYSGFALGPTVREWLPLEVGINNWYVTVVGGNANLSMSFYNQWP